MARIDYREINGGGAYWALLLGLGVLVLVGLGSAWFMEHHGHVVTGMSNRIVWGMPHVFAIFLILAASGVLNVASIASVFEVAAYKPLARLSGLMAVGLLIGGLVVLVLDLGRPERLIVAMTTYNFKSIFAWNIFLYTGFLVVVLAYLFVQMERRMTAYTKPVGWFALVWRLVLTTGTGSIFGWLIAREAYDTAIMAPFFIAMSFAYGLASFILVLAAVCALNGRELSDRLLARLGRLLGYFAGAVLYMSAAMHATNLYAAEHTGVEWFLLVGGGAITLAFWLGHVVIGCLAPMVLTLHPGLAARRTSAALASVLVIIGGIANLYAIIIGGQAYPLTMFPGYEEASSFYDGVVAGYTPSLPEIGLGLGGAALGLAIILVGMRVLRFLPRSLADPASQAAQ